MFQYLHWSYGGNRLYSFAVGFLIEKNSGALADSEELFKVNCNVRSCS